MLKKGDKVFCKKDYGILFYENKMYVIESVPDIPYNNFYYVWVCGDKLENKIFAVRFLLNEKTSVSFGDYFYTMKEYRKMKLKKINEN